MGTTNYSDKFKGYAVHQITWDSHKLNRLKLEFSAMISRLGKERNHMKALRFSDAQKAFIIKQGEEGTPSLPCDLSWVLLLSDLDAAARYRS